MDILDKTFVFPRGQTFMRFKDRVDCLDDAELIVIQQYALLPKTGNISEDMFGSLLKLNKPIYIDSTFELIEQDIFELLSKFDDLTQVFYFAIPREKTYCEEIRQSLIGKGLTIIERQFFIDFSHHYIPTIKGNSPLPPKSFLCLNGKTRPQRTLLVSYLAHFNLIDRGYVSFFGNTHVDKSFDVGKIEDVFSLNLNPQQRSIVENGLSQIKFPLLLDTEIMNASVSHEFNFSAQHYNAVDYVVVTESNQHPRDGIFFVTEKTIKAINMNKKLIVHSTPNFLTKLKDYYLKYQNKDISHLTDWCDTTYDKFTGIERVESIIKTMNEVEYGGK